MRICIVTRSAPVHGIGGLEDHTRDLAQGLVQAGHEIEVITSRHPGGDAEDVVAGARWHFVQAPSHDFTNRLWRARSLEAFLRLHRARPFDLVHSQGSSALELARHGIHRFLPSVVMFHGNFLGLVKASLRRQRRARHWREIAREQRELAHLARRHFAHANWRIFNTWEAIVPSRQQVLDTRRSHRLDPSRVHVVPNGVDTRQFRPRPRDEARRQLGLPQGPLLLCAGRLTPDKGTHHAVAALAVLRARGHDARLLIVGDGPDRERIKQTGRRLGVEDHVLLAGPQPPDQMPVHFAGADVFVFPTERDEAAPLVLPQAMACGLPVVASATGSVPEVVDRPGENGLLVPPGNVSALARALELVLASPDLRRRLGAEALRRVRNEYTLERMVDRTQEVYQIAQARFRRISSRSFREPS